METIRVAIEEFLFHRLVPQWVIDRVSRNAIYYIFFGCIAAIVDWSIFFVFAILLGFHYSWAATAAFLAGNSTNYVCNKWLNFQNKTHRVGKQFVIHLAIGLGGLALTYFFLYCFIDLLGVPKMAAKIISTAIIAFYGYTMHRSFTFNLNVV